jgi:RNA polymerase sigma-70 factor, ECF subfamily
MTTTSDKNFTAIYDRYYSRIHGFIRARLQDAWQADDLTQEAFLQARRRLGTLRDRDKIKPWLFRIAYNICRDHYREVGNRPGLLIPLEGTGGIADPRGIEKSLEQQQMCICVQKHIQLLPDDYRTVLWLYDVLGFTHKEIGEVLGVHSGNVKVRLHRARKKLKAILEANCRFERDERNVFVCVPEKTA